MLAVFLSCVKLGSLHVLTAMGDVAMMLLVKSGVVSVSVCRYGFRLCSCSAALVRLLGIRLDSWFGRAAMRSCCRMSKQCCADPRCGVASAAAAE